jgi:circadian clock protein KaiC
MPTGGLSALSEATVVLRYVEWRSWLFRLISLFKVRESAFDPTIRKFEINGAGMVVGDPFEDIDTTLSGIGREVARRAAPPEGPNRRSPGGFGQPE